MNFNARKCNDGISRDRARAHPLWTIEEDDMRLVEVEHVVALVAERGLETVLADLVDHIEADFRRWDEFGKSPLFARHSPAGVIQLKPAADDRAFGFKYGTGHPGTYCAGLQPVPGCGWLS